MAVPESIDNWRITDRCQFCFDIADINVDRLKPHGQHMSWSCLDCKGLNLLVSPAKAGRIPLYVQAFVLAGKPRPPVVEPPPPPPKPTFTVYSHPPKLPWWKRLFRWQS
jgi:hypothetical protein